MHPHRPAHRRESTQVYRVRRALVATGAVLAGVAALNITGVLGDDGGESSAPTTTAPATTTTTIPPLPACTEADVQVPENPATDWATVLVDTARAIPDYYVPGDLQNISESGFPFTDGQAVRALVSADLGALRQAAADNGTPISIVASYRSYAQQLDLYERRVDELGANEAGSRVARPGHSEHQLGTAVDITSAGETDVDQAWGSAPAGQWIATNAHKFGFLLSYPIDASERTCYDYEPWHLRYVGRDMAAEVIASGLTLREFLWQRNPVDITTTTVAPATTATTTAAP